VVLNGAVRRPSPRSCRNTDPASQRGHSSNQSARRLHSHLPLGIELDGPAGTDRRLLAIAAAIAAALSASFEAAP